MVVPGVKQVEGLKYLEDDWTVALPVGVYCAVLCCGPYATSS